MRYMQKRDTYRPTNRYILFVFIVLVMFSYLVYGLVTLQLTPSEDYETKADTKRTKKIALTGSRGMITDADSVILAQDEKIYNVTFYKDGSKTSASAYSSYTASIIDTIDVVEKNGGTMSLKFVIERDAETNNWQFNFGKGVSESVLEAREKSWRSNNYMTATKYPTAEDCIVRLKALYQIPEGTSEELMLKIMAIYSEMQMNLFNSQPIVIANDVSRDTVHEIESKAVLLNGMEIAVGTKRVYPRGSLAAQVIGYTGKITNNTKYYEELEPKGYAYNDTIGQDGIESSMEDWLTQNSSIRKGYRLVERNNMSTITRELEYVEPQDGNNVKLTIIASYQQEAERAIATNVEKARALQEKEMFKSSWKEKKKDAIRERNWTKFPLELAVRGAMVVVDMEGRVLADANAPTFDLNWMISGGDEAVAILTDERKLLMNYAIHARGTPGSIFKMVTSVAALVEGVLTPEETINDEGYYRKYNEDINTAPKCWISEGQRGKHQNQTIIQGLKNSCNYFFYTLGDRLGAERLYRYSALFGMTSLTGIDLPGEQRSVVGSQVTLYDQNNPVGESTQDTARPIIVFNSIKKHLRKCGASYNIEYDDERLDRCVKSLMDMAVNNDQGTKGKIWLEQMRIILMEELNMTQEMVYLQAIIGDTYNYLNNIKWGGGETIMTAIGQSVTYVTPAAVARYVCAVANGGTVYNLMLVDSITSPDGTILSQRTPTISTVIEGAEQYMPYIHQGMKGVVDEDGTAGEFFENSLYKDRICGKTGTAQVTSIDLENNAWFVAFVPIEKPEIALVTFIPNGWKGAEAARSASEFIDWYMKQKELRTVDAQLPVGNTLAP